MEDEKGRKRSFTLKGRAYEIEVSEKEIKRLRSKLLKQLSYFECLKEKNVRSIEDEMVNTETILNDLQTQVERYVKACEEDDASKAAEIMEMLKAEEEGVQKVKTAVRTWLEAQISIDDDEKSKSSEKSEDRKSRASRSLRSERKFQIEDNIGPFET